MSHIAGSVIEVFIGDRKIGVASTTDDLLGFMDGDIGHGSMFGKPITITINGEHDGLQKLIELDAVRYDPPPMIFRDNYRGPRNRWGGLK